MFDVDDLQESKTDTSQLPGEAVAIENIIYRRCLVGTVFYLYSLHILLITIAIDIVLTRTRRLVRNPYLLEPVFD